MTFSLTTREDTHFDFMGHVHAQILLVTTSNFLQNMQQTHIYVNDASKRIIIKLQTFAMAMKSYDMQA